MIRKRFNLRRKALISGYGNMPKISAFAYTHSSDLLLDGASDVAGVQGAHPVTPVTSITLSILKSAWWKPAHIQTQMSNHVLLWHKPALLADATAL